MRLMSPLLLILGVAAISLVFGVISSSSDSRLHLGDESVVKAGFRDRSFEIVCIELLPGMKAGVYSLDILPAVDQKLTLELSKGGVVVAEQEFSGWTIVSRSRPAQVSLPGYIRLGIGRRAPGTSNLYGADSLLDGEALVVETSRSMSRGVQKSLEGLCACADTSDLPVATGGTIVSLDTEEKAGGAISGAVVAFSPERGGATVVVESDDSGRYRASLPIGRYRAVVEHPGFVTYDTAPGWVVIANEAAATVNFFLEESGSLTGGERIHRLSSLAAGVVAVRDPDKGIGEPIPGASILFLPEGDGTPVGTQSDQEGRYKVILPLGRYRVVVECPGFETYDTAPGWNVVVDRSANTGNFFLWRADREEK